MGWWGSCNRFLCTQWFGATYGTLSFKTNYWGYLIKRFVRIYILYYFWIFITFALFILFSPYEVTGLRDWFYDKWQGPITKLDIMNHFVLLNNFFTDNYNPVIWSLAQEMRISIVFPLFFLLFYKQKEENDTVCYQLFFNRYFP